MDLPIVSGGSVASVASVGSLIAGGSIGSIIGLKKGKGGPANAQGGILMQVPPNHVGVRMRWKKLVRDKEGKVRIYECGTYPQVPVRNSYITIFVGLDKLEYDNQSAWTADNLCFRVKGQVICSIEDANKALFEPADYRPILLGACQDAVLTSLRKMQSATIDRELIGTEVKQAIEAEMLEDLGLKVDSFKVLSLDPTPQADEAMSVEARANKSLQSIKQARDEGITDPALLLALVGRATTAVTVAPKEEVQVRTTDNGVVGVDASGTLHTVHTVSAVSQAGGEGGNNGHK